MEELIEKVENLKNLLDKSDEVVKYYEFQDMYRMKHIK